MKLGFLTAALPDLSLEQVAAWAASEGFESLEVACWPGGGGEKRRYAGVTHIDVEAFCKIVTPNAATVINRATRIPESMFERTNASTSVILKLG